MTRSAALLPGPLATSLASALVCSTLLAGSARAHGIQSTLERLPDLTAQLESSFSSGMPARDAAVRLIPPGGEPITVGQTDARGHLSFRLPPQASPDWEIQVDAGPGHRDYLELPAAASSPGAASLTRGAGAPAGLRTSLLALGGLGGVGLLAGLLRRRARD